MKVESQILNQVEVFRVDTLSCSSTIDVTGGPSPNYLLKRGKEDEKTCKVKRYYL